MSIPAPVALTETQRVLPAQQSVLSLLSTAAYSLMMPLLASDSIGSSQRCRLVQNTAEAAITTAAVAGTSRRRKSALSPIQCTRRTSRPLALTCGNETAAP